MTERFCRRGPFCTARDGHGQPAVADRALCIRDEDELGRVLREMLETLIQLRIAALAALPGHGLSERTAGGTTEPQLPFRADLDELANDLVGTAVEWATAVADVARCPAPPPGRHYAGNALAIAAQILYGRRSVFLALQPRTVQRGDESLVMDGGDAALELLWLHHRVGAVLGRTRKVLHLPEPCPACGVKLTLAHYAGSSDVRCSSCHAESRLDDIQGVSVHNPKSNTSIVALGENQWTRETVTQLPEGRFVVREQWTGHPETNAAAVLVGKTETIYKDRAEESL